VFKNSIFYFNDKDIAETTSNLSKAHVRQSLFSMQ